MIDINLLGKNSGVSLPVVAGMDLNLINFKMVLIGLISLYLPGALMEGAWEEDKKIIDQKVSEQNKIIKNLEKDIKKNSTVKSQLDAFNKQVGKLELRSEQVDKILKSKTNPKKVLEKIARTIPKDMWFSRLDIDNDRNLVIIGSSETYTSIGNFMIYGNESPYFGKTLDLAETSTGKVSGKEGGEERVESFTIKGKIESFDPFAGVN